MKKIFTIAKHITTIISLGISFIALRNAYYYLNINNKYWYILFAIIVVYLFAVIFSIIKTNDKLKNLIYCITLHVIPIILSIFLFWITPRLQVRVGTINKYEKSFNDIQSTQIKAAKKNGILPFNTRDEAKKAIPQLVKDKKLVKLSSNSKYFVRKLTHSTPYVIPEVEKLLADIAANFQEISGTKSRFEVTSVLRTKEDISLLKKSNSVATTNSCHSYGTTIDISYAKFKTDKINPRSNRDLRKYLSMAIHKLRKEKRCYVKIEKQQKCYHITVR